MEDDYLEQELRTKCQLIIPEPEEVEAKDCVNTYLYLKDRFHSN